MQIVRKYFVALLLCTSVLADDNIIALNRENLFRLLQNAATSDGMLGLCVDELEDALGPPDRFDTMDESAQNRIRVYLLSPTGELKVTSGSGYVYTAIIVFADGRRELVWK